MYEKLIIERINQTLRIKQNILKDNELIKNIDEIAKAIINAYKENKKVVLFGNGGSAADAQHLTAELVNRFYFDRKSLPAMALTVNASILTAIGNDYSFDKIFSRQIEGIGKGGDIAIGISTSGNSKNVIEAINVAKKKKLFTIAFTGRSGGKLKKIADICLQVPHDDTPRIQEIHIMIGHIICEIIEKELFG
ncbi:MAG: D-sedoheptulose 7-phosphate isomerase [Actinomycetia bacterium]|nr:D-sedoheptulose 7-phosphate isomerase [Actinomycetes bacterium]